MNRIVSALVTTLILNAMLLAQTADTTGPAKVAPKAPALSAQSSDAAPIPDIASLFKDVEAHQRQIRSLRRKYMFREVQTEDELDGNGQVKHSQTEEREVFFIGRSSVSRLIKKDGVELTASEQKKEQQRVDKVIEERKKREVKREKNEEEGKQSENEITLDTFLRIAKFENPRRISFKGRNALVFDFSGDPDAKTHGMAENTVKKVAGTVWVDEADREVIRMEVKLNEPFKIAGGLLATIQKGTTFTYEQALINGEIWLPTYVESNVTARVMLFKGLRQHSIAHYSDYRKFQVATKMEVVGQEVPKK
ncbi:MAG: hypothetical protein JWO13_1310 [Acidobacteriales bacterium]|nr:hypothetical protein [Terriglobales bacterium]